MLINTDSFISMDIDMTSISWANGFKTSGKEKKVEKQVWQPKAKTT